MFHYPIPYRPPVSEELKAYAATYGVLTDDEIAGINAVAQAIPPKPVVVGTESQLNPKHNRSVVRWLLPGPDTDWIYQRLTNVVSILNAESYCFEISGLDEPIYHVTYHSDEEGHYAWHTDANRSGAYARKLSITVQMSDPASYDGGDLEMNAFGTPEAMPRDSGSVILFPSWQVHRVTPVVRGLRSALVAWIAGPPFR